MDSTAADLCPRIYLDDRFFSLVDHRFHYFIHCEDLDWCMAFRKAGWKILFVPDLEITHVKGVPTASRPYMVEYHKHRGMIYFYNKFFRHQYPGVLMWLVIMSVWLRFFGRCFKIWLFSLKNILKRTDDGGVKML